jgi:hypothetical protein
VQARAATPMFINSQNLLRRDLSFQVPRVLIALHEHIGAERLASHQRDHFLSRNFLRPHLAHAVVAVVGSYSVSACFLFPSSVTFGPGYCKITMNG